MHPRHVLLTLAVVFISMGAQHRTPNFVINTNARVQQAQLIGQWAEHYRREKAKQWLGHEMPTWNQPCPLRVVVSMEAPQGRTSFTYSSGQVIGMDMEIQGPLDRVISSVLPHEITHTVFAFYFRCAVPRWADEGGSVLSEDGPERQRHDQLTRDVLNNRQEFRLRTLMNLTEYPPDGQGVMKLYAQGYSLSDYLVKRTDHQTFLKFVHRAMTMGNNWDRACQEYLGMRSVEELEGAWLQYLRDTRGGKTVDVAQNRKPAADSKPNSFVRTTLPPAQPLDPVPIVRGAAPEPAGKRPADSQGLSLPAIQIPGTSWQPATVPNQTATVQLGQPQFSQPRYNQPQPPPYVPANFAPQYVAPACNGPQCQPYFQQPFSPGLPFTVPR